MKNLKEFINTKQDIYGLKTKWSDEILEYLKSEYDKAFCWSSIGDLNKKTDGIVDDTHKIEKRGDKWVQFEKKLNLQADIFKKLKFSEDELLELIKKIELHII